MDPRKSKFVQFSPQPIYLVELYNELLNRHDHLRDAVQLRREATLCMKNEKSPARYIRYNSIAESVSWFFTVEYFSRFLSDPAKPNNSQRCLLALVQAIDRTEGLMVEQKFKEFIDEKHETIAYISRQRKKYFAHADEVTWATFPNLFDGEHEMMLDSVADILDLLGKKMHLNNICRREALKDKIVLS